MKKRIDKSRKSEKDLEELALYIANDDSAAALRFLDAAEKAFEFLTSSPDLGSPWETPQRPYGSMRFWPVPGFANHLIFYEVREDCIRVVRVLHGARDLDGMI